MFKHMFDIRGGLRSLTCWFGTPILFWRLIVLTHQSRRRSNCLQVECSDYIKGENLDIDEPKDKDGNPVSKDSPVPDTEPPDVDDPTATRFITGPFEYDCATFERMQIPRVGHTCRSCMAVSERLTSS